jgi:hypothetical protein
LAIAARAAAAGAESAAEGAQRVGVDALRHRQRRTSMAKAGAWLGLAALSPAQWSRRRRDLVIAAVIRPRPASTRAPSKVVRGSRS